MSGLSIAVAVQDGRKPVQRCQQNLSLVNHWSPSFLPGAVPEPNNRAVADSFLNSFAADPALAAFSTTAGAMIAALVEPTVGFGRGLGTGLSVTTKRWS